MAIPRSHPARGGGRRRIGEENEQTRERRQGCRGNTEAGQLGSAQVPDDRRIRDEK